MEKSIAERLDAIESVEEIRKLKHTYMHYCDIGYLPEKLGPQFTKDAIWTNDFFGHYEGRKAIEDHFDKVSGTIVFAAHLALNSIIDVDGDKATGKWRILMPFTNVEDGHKISRLMLGEYDEEYERHDGKWYFSKMDFFINFNVPADEGWQDVALIRP